jgi:hypothetical protein
MGKKYTVEAKWIGKKYISLENLHNHKYKKKEHRLPQKKKALSNVKHIKYSNLTPHLSEFFLLKYSVNPLSFTCMIK